ncbi:hypothetical protein ACQY1Q_01505 [Tenacibaculum sp. TC6]|uniref:hypothetical protein n=1 Tax=Tenacibaculum sp. TC6 TaxID=3423223 RepID=UPI003D35C1CF
MKFIKLFFLCMLTSACVTIPKSTNILTQQMAEETNNMHNLNISLVQQLFNERKQRLNTFITNKYTPSLIERYKKLLPDTINYKKELGNIITSIIPVIEAKKDSLNTILDNQEKQIISQLNTNYQKFTRASNSLQNLISSATKVNDSEENIIQSVDNITHNKFNLNAIENELDSLLGKTSNIFNKLKPFEKSLK